MSNADKKQYKCILATNGYAEGETAWLTDAEVANFNGGEKLPRFAPVEEASQSTAMSEENKQEGEESAPETPEAPKEGEGEAETPPAQAEGQPEGGEGGEAGEQ